jgi:hypothetical protein
MRPRPARTALLAALGLTLQGCELLDPPPGTAPTLLFDYPLIGEMNVDFFDTNYVDLQPGAGIVDFACGAKSYDGHQGVDIVLPSFARMDAGVTVVAAAAGNVSQVVDGLPDRNTSWSEGHGFGNHVVIAHPDGYISVYAHLKKGSVAVASGQAVTSGTPLGEVGSSGMSNMPHLHLEIHRGGRVVDPYAGACGAAETHWRNPLSYEGDFRLIDTGITRGPLLTGAVKGPPPHVHAFAPGDTVTVWTHLHNVRAGRLSRWSLVSPAGEVVSSFERLHESFHSMSWWWANWVPSEPGAWRIDYEHDGVLLGSHAFTVSSAAGAAPAGGAAWRRPFGGGEILGGGEVR